eukprot:324502-Pelagomonas_calceolata.AAC.2
MQCRPRSKKLSFTHGTNQRALGKDQTVSAETNSELHQWSWGLQGEAEILLIRRVISQLSRRTPRPPDRRFL